MNGVEYIGDHEAYVCECGCVHFNLLRSGNIECSGCGERGLFVYGIPCPECNSIDTETKLKGGESMIPEQECEFCNECAFEWNHR